MIIDPKSRDIALVARCLNGDRKAYEQIYAHYSAWLFALCLRYSNSAEEAEDALQEAFVKIFQNLSQYSRESSFQGWIKAITVHAALAQHKKKNSKVYLNADAIDNEDIEFDLSLMGEIDGEELFYYINKLSPGRKQVFCAYYLEGYSHKEIADLFGISEGTSKSQLHDAKKELKNAISLNFSESRKKENYEQSR